MGYLHSSGDYSKRQLKVVILLLPAIFSAEHRSYLIKRLRKLGLTDAYRNDTDTQTIFRCLLSLPLLPVADIAPGFQELKALLPAQSATSASRLQLFRYVERQWINRQVLQAVCA